MPIAITTEQALKLMTENDRIMRECERQAAIMKEKASAFDALEQIEHCEVYIDKTRTHTEEGIPVQPVAIHFLKWNEAGDAAEVCVVSGKTLAEAVARIAAKCDGEARHACPVCEYDQMTHPPKDYMICPQCGTEFGNDDTLKTYSELRAAWEAKGRSWFSRKTQDK